MSEVDSAYRAVAALSGGQATHIRCSAAFSSYWMAAHAAKNSASYARQPSVPHTLSSATSSAHSAIIFSAVFSQR